jgi:tetratricopeptide (TPR) repeat protein
MSRIERYCIFAGLILICLISSTSGATQIQNVPAGGRLVLARRPGVAFFEGARAVATVPDGLLLDVLSVKGGWLWTGRGWVRETDVIPLEEAVPFFDAVIRDQPSAFAFVSRGRAQFELHQYDSAVADCTRAHELEPRYAPALCNRGRAYGQKNENERALADLSQAIGLDSNLASAHICRAQIWLNMNQVEKAIEDATLAIKTDPRSARAFAIRAKALCRHGEHQQAIADFDSALRLHPSFHPVLNNRGNAYFKLGEYQKAIEDYTAALAITPTAQIYLNRAIAWSHLGASDEANQDYARVAQLDPALASASDKRAGSDRD